MCVVTCRFVLCVVCWWLLLFVEVCLVLFALLLFTCCFRVFHFVVLFVACRLMRVPFDL